MFNPGETGRRRIGEPAQKEGWPPFFDPCAVPAARQDSAGACQSESPDAGADAESDAVDATNLVPPEILDGGEIIIFAVKPSLWFVLLKSSRWLVGMLATLLVIWWAGEAAFPIDTAIIIQAAIALGLARVGLALLQWVSRLYILTNRRIIRLTGIFNIDLFECQLTRIQSTFLTMTWYERLLGIGTISFATAAAGGIEVSWSNVNHPLELHERVRSAIHRAQRPSNGL